MAFTYPQDTEEFQKERRSYQILFYMLNADVWAPNGSDKTDHGMDYGFEYIEDYKYRGYRILSQIKSTEHIDKSATHVRFDLSVKTASYAVASSQPFVLFVIDLKSESAYYACLQDYFMENAEAFTSLQKNKSTVRIKMPLNQVVTRMPSQLELIAKRQYCFANNAIARTR